MFVSRPGILTVQQNFGIRLLPKAAQLHSAASKMATKTDVATCFGMIGSIFPSWKNPPPPLGLRTSCWVRITPRQHAHALSCSLFPTFPDEQSAQDVFTRVNRLQASQGTDCCAFFLSSLDWYGFTFIRVSCRQG